MVVMKVKNIRILIVVLAATVLVIQLMRIDYSDPGWSANATLYLGIAAMVLLIASMVISNRSDGKQKTKA